MAAGTTRRGHEPFEPEQVVETDHDQHVYWRGIGEWTTLAGAEAPSFDRIPGDWTYVWGRAEGPIDRAYDLQTGHRTEDTSTEGAYLLKSHAPDDVDIEGTHAARGGPIPERRATLPQENTSERIGRGARKECWCGWTAAASPGPSN